MAESIPHLHAELPAEDIVAGLKESGAVIVEGMLNAETLARFNAEIDEHLGAADSERPLLNPLITAFFGPHTRHITGVAAKSRTFVDEVLIHPVLMAACDAILRPSCADYRLNVAHVLDRGPGAEQQLLHRDELVWVHMPRPHPELQLASIIALEDFDADNGATRVVPGSHRWPLEREPGQGELVAAEMPAGAAVIYLGSTIHGGGANVTRDRRRRGMHVSYNLGWLRTEENNYLTATPDVVRSMPRRAQQLLGYSVHDAILSGGGYLGAVDTRNPLDMLESGEL